MKKFASTVLIALSALTLQACSSTPEEQKAPEVVNYTAEQLAPYMQEEPLNDLSQEQTAKFYFEYRKEERQLEDLGTTVVLEVDVAQDELEAAGQSLIDAKGRDHAKAFFEPIGEEIYTHLEDTLFTSAKEFENIPRYVNKRTLDGYLKALRADFYLGEAEHFMRQHIRNLEEATLLLKEEAKK